MSRFKTLIVDDEPLARETVRDLLARDPEIEVVGECGDGASALESIRALRPDVVFLDVEMPECGGLQVAGALAPEEMPAIVFATAYSRHAVSAFEVEALDYVVKPFTDERFFAALERAKRRVREQKLGELAGRMASLGAELGQGGVAETPEPREAEETPEPFLTRIRVSAAGRTLILKAREVAWIESDDYYARIHSDRGAHLVRTSLATFERRLDPGLFLRIHRGAIVNLDRVTEIEHLFKGALRVVLEDGTRLPVSRSRRRQVESTLAPKLSRR